MTYHWTRFALLGCVVGQLVWLSMGRWFGMMPDGGSGRPFVWSSTHDWLVVVAAISVVCWWRRVGRSIALLVGSMVCAMLAVSHQILTFGSLVGPRFEYATVFVPGLLLWGADLAWWLASRCQGRGTTAHCPRRARLDGRRDADASNPRR